MPPQQLAKLIATLSPEQQRAVEEFIVYLKTTASSPPLSFRAALDSFVRDHPELLRRLAR
ncbi:MAG: hypothetical protein ACRD7E_28775 [Bryobacteraceae bacterium]